MKKIIISFVVVSVFVIFVVYLRANSTASQVANSAVTAMPNTTTSASSENASPLAGSSTTSAPAPTAAPKPKPKPSPAPAPAPPAPKGQYKDGSYTGPVTDAFYGPYQVRAVISGGRLADVIILQQPSDRRTSVEINSQAGPILQSEAIAAQSAQIDVVSGASQSSGAFVESLAAALAQAKN